MGFDKSDDHIFASIATPDGLAEHAECFADAGRVAKKDLEYTCGLFRRAASSHCSGVLTGFTFPDAASLLTRPE